MIEIIKNIIENELINARNLTSLSDIAVKMNKIEVFFGEKQELECPSKLMRSLKKSISYLELILTVIKNYKNLP